MEQEYMQESGARTNTESVQADSPNPQADIKSPEPSPLGAYPFRGAAFGGFSRQDVLDYLKKMQQEHENALQSLQGELEAARGQCAAASERAARLAEADDTTERRVTELQTQLDAAQEMLRQKSEAFEALETVSAGQKAKEAEMEAELRELRPQAEAYLRLKDRAASIELDAHERAQLTLERANRESERVRGRYMEWVQEMQGEYEELREDISLTFQKTTQEFARLCSVLERTAQEFDDHEEELQSFLQQAGQGD